MHKFDITKTDYIAPEKSVDFGHTIMHFKYKPLIQKGFYPVNRFFRNFLGLIRAEKWHLVDIDDECVWAFGKLHRINGPAIEFSAVNFYYINGKCYNSKESWFAALTSKQKYEAIWNMN